MGIIGFQSYPLTDRADANPWWNVIVQGLTHAMMIGGFLMIFVPQPFYLCENGVSVGEGDIPWHYIRSAEWTPKNRSVLRLHRLDGDLFVRVPDHLRDGVQRLIAARTRFVAKTEQIAPGQ